MPRSTNSAFTILARQLECPRPCQLARDRELDLAGELRVLAMLRRLDRIPQLLAIGRSSGAPSGSITSEWTTPALFEKS